MPNKTLIPCTERPSPPNRERREGLQTLGNFESHQKETGGVEGASEGPCSVQHAIRNSGGGKEIKKRMNYKKAKLPLKGGRLRTSTEKTWGGGGGPKGKKKKNPEKRATSRKKKLPASSSPARKHPSPTSKKGNPRKAENARRGVQKK